MSVVAVTSTDEDNAAAVFETLNDRGIGLSTPDLLRNLLLRRASDADGRDRIVAAWQTILGIDEEVGVDQFLRHYWVSQRGDVKARKLYREIKSKVIDENTDSLSFSLDLAETAPLYRDLARMRDDDPEMRRQLEGIRLLGAKALYPVLLSGYSVLGDAADKEPLRQLAAALTTMFVRYNVIGGRETTVMESTVYRIAAELRTSGNFDEAIAALADLAPEADEFLARFQRAGVSRITTARYLLREIEHAKRRTQEVSVEGTDRVHVEHIYPQTPAFERWTNHRSMIDRLGNLTLLGKRLNTSIKNSDFDAKKAQAYEQSDILMTRELVSWDEWDAGAIDARQQELANWAFDIWHFPGEVPPEPPPSGDDEAISEEEQQALDLEAAPEQLPEVPTG
jgi:hypothetical protein